MYLFVLLVDTKPTKSYYHLQLFDAIESRENQDYTVISWSKDGKSFTIVRPDKFLTDIVPIFFKPVKLMSFLRRLGRWGFESVSTNSHSYRHAKFLRDRRDLVMMIRCPQSMGSSVVRLPKKARAGAKKKSSLLITKRAPMSITPSRSSDNLLSGVSHKMSVREPLAVSSSDVVPIYQNKQPVGVQPLPLLHQRSADRFVRLGVQRPLPPVQFRNNIENGNMLHYGAQVGSPATLHVSPSHPRRMPITSMPSESMAGYGLIQSRDGNVFVIDRGLMQPVSSNGPFGLGNLNQIQQQVRGFSVPSSHQQAYLL